MTAKDYLQLISDEIHTTIVATVDDEKDCPSRRPST